MPPKMRLGSPRLVLPKLATAPGCVCPLNGSGTWSRRSSAL